MVKRTLLILGLTLAVLSFDGSIAFAQSEETVAASVTVQSVSLTVSPTSIDYGTIPFESSQRSDLLPTPVTFTATNTGNVAESFLVKGTNAAGTNGGTPFTWTLVQGPFSCPTALNQFRHRVTPTGLTPVFLTTADAYLATGIAAGGGQDFTSEFYTPCFGSDGAGAVASTNIIVGAVSP